MLKTNFWFQTTPSELDGVETKLDGDTTRQDMVKHGLIYIISFRLVIWKQIFEISQDPYMKDP